MFFSSSIQALSASGRCVFIPEVSEFHFDALARHSGYQRVRLAQFKGKSTRYKWHHAKSDDRGAGMDLPRPEWLFDFDAEKHVQGAFEPVSRAIEENGYVLPVLP